MSKTKIIEIECCNGCPHYTWERCEETEEEIKDDTKIHEDCPLEDLKHD